MPAKSAMPYLIACLDSIIQQTYTNWELIVVDDHSTDTTFDILSRYALHDSRIKVCRLESDAGIIAALRLAFLNSKGTYITRMDTDDLMGRNKLKDMIEALTSHERGTLATGKVKYFRDGGISDGYSKYEKWINTRMDRNDHWQHIYKECVIPSPAWMMHRGDLETIGAFDSDRYPEDYDLCFKMKKHNLLVQSISSVLHYWRDYSDRTSRIDSNYKDNRFLELKVHHFISQDYNREMSLRLWGAGKKGKQITALLSKESVPFTWHTNNVKKIGNQIGDSILRSEQELLTSPSCQVLIAFANPEDQAEAEQKIRTILPPLRHQVFFFC